MTASGASPHFDLVAWMRERDRRARMRFEAIMEAVFPFHLDLSGMHVEQVSNVIALVQACYPGPLMVARYPKTEDFEFGDILIAETGEFYLELREGASEQDLCFGLRFKAAEDAAFARMLF